MRKVLMMFALLTSFMAAHTQRGGGDYFEGLSHKIGFNRMIPPHGLEITYDRTVHVILPSPIKYVDLGPTSLIASEADGAENLIRVKAAGKHLRNETNMGVITGGGNFYTFNVKYTDEPLLLNVEMCDFIHDGETVNRPNSAVEIYLQELGSESPRLVRLVMKSVHKQDKHWIKHIGCKRFGVRFLFKGLYTHGDLFYFHTEVRNVTHVPFDVDFATFKIVDKKTVRCTVMQKQVIYPLRAFNYAIRMEGERDEHTVFALSKFTIPNDKKLVVEMYEKQGGRHQIFEVDNEDLVRAETINELQVR